MKNTQKQNNLVATGFIPCPHLDVKNAVLDMLSCGCAKFTTGDVVEYLTHRTNGAWSRVLVNRWIGDLIEKGIIEQVIDDDLEDYMWKKKEECEYVAVTEKTAEKKAKKKTNKKVEEENPSNSKSAKKYTVDTDEGNVTFYTEHPDTFNKENWKGYWMATSDEALEIFIVDGKFKSSDVKDIVSQLVNCDKQSVKVKKI